MTMVIFSVYGHHFLKSWRSTLLRHPRTSLAMLWFDPDDEQDHVYEPPSSIELPSRPSSAVDPPFPNARLPACASILSSPESRVSQQY